jgi:ATP-binding cassette subfamily F protein uup
VQRTPSVAPPPARRKLSYLEQREYDMLEERIDEADQRLRDAELRIEAPEVVTDSEALTSALAELEDAKAEHHTAYQRWLELTEKVDG